MNEATELGPLRVLVNSAGIGRAQRTIGKDGQFDSAHNLDGYKKVIAINLIGTFDCIRLAATAMGRTEPLASGERGAIVSMASVAAFDGQIGQAAIYGEGEGSEAFKAKLGESVLFPHRLGDPEELASMVVELVTNSYMNAEVVRVDGGIRMPPK